MHPRTATNNFVGFQAAAAIYLGTMTSDLELLQNYADRNSDEAFAELVRRHLDLVYSAALRQVRSPQLAEEVAQSVFTDLARNAGKLKPDTVLTAWLYQVTRRTAVDVVRKESRRQLREQIASEMNAMNATAPDWTHVEPFLDEAMHTLDDTDRAAVLLRYFENKSFREVGQTLGTSDDAAQKRVSRAVERLREFLSKHGVTVGASGLVVVISANAVQAAPIGLAATISTAAIFAGTAVSTSTVIAATKAIAMTTLQKTLITATIAAAVGTGIYEARQASTLRTQVQTLQQQQAPSAEQIRQLQRERDEATNRLAGLLAENARLKSDAGQTELLKLRGEIGRLRRVTAPDRMAGANSESASPSSDATNQVSTEDQFILKRTHAVDTMGALLTAIEHYAAGNNGQYPESLDQLIASGHFATSNFVGNLGPNDFEIPPPGTTNYRGQKVLLQLRVPIPRPGYPAAMILGVLDGDRATMSTEIFNISE
jgi:RNA polymerase sigma factor (sigma-70 family)